MREFAKSHLEIWLNRQVYGVGLALLFAVGLTWLGALESHQHALFSRFGYWTANLIAWSLTSSLVLAALRLWKPTAKLNRWQRMIAATIIASLPMLSVTISTTMYIADWVPTPDELFEQIGAIWIIGGVFLLVQDSSGPFQASEPSDASLGGQWALPHPPIDPIVEPSPAPIANMKLLDRLPPSLGTDLICLRVEDHYVRIYTPLGNALVLTRFTDALDSVASLDGLRVHRSWWVASKAIDQVSRSARTAQLTLTNGMIVPVSLPYMEAMTIWQRSRDTNA